jgi:hypothetical protein
MDTPADAFHSFPQRRCRRHQSFLPNRHDESVSLDVRPASLHRHLDPLRGVRLRPSNPHHHLGALRLRQPRLRRHAVRHGAGSLPVGLLSDHHDDGAPGELPRDGVGGIWRPGWRRLHRAGLHHREGGRGTVLVCAQAAALDGHRQRLQVPHGLFNHHTSAVPALPDDGCSCDP